jgi:Tfp pilus assembly protein PilO
MAFDYRSEYQRYRNYYLKLRRFYEQPTAKISFFVILSFLMVSFFSVFAIKPTLTTIGKLVREIEDKRRLNQILDQKIMALEQVQTLIPQLSTDVLALKRALPEEEALGRLVQEFEFLAQEDEVVLISMKFEPLEVTKERVAKKGEINFVRFDLMAGGEFEELKQFLNDLERLDRILVVEEVSFRSGSGVLKQGGVPTTIELTGRAPYLPPKKG